MEADLVNRRLCLLCGGYDASFSLAVMQLDELDIA
jgi:hypothetical protein